MTTTTATPPPLGASGRTASDWLAHLARIGADHGFFERVGPRHYALFVQESDTLVVSFDSAPRIFSQAADGLPSGFAAVQRRDYSLLSIISKDGGTFRHGELETFFVKLAAEGFFESFKNVIFLGHGPHAGHAACAYSRAAKGASVLASNPLAGFDPDFTGFDTALRPERRRAKGPFDDAPSALKEAASAVVLFDPYDARMGPHAGQFRGENIFRVPVRFAGATVPVICHMGDVNVPLMRAMANGRMTRAKAMAVLRPKRRTSSAYLWHLMSRLMATGHFDRASVVASYAAKVTGEARFEEKAQGLSRNGNWAV